MRFALSLLSRFGTFLLGLIGEMFHGIGHAISGMLRSAAHRAGRFIGRLAVWSSGAAIIVWLIKTQPEVLGQLGAIAILVYAIWRMLKSPFRKGRK